MFIFIFFNLVFSIIFLIKILINNKDLILSLVYLEISLLFSQLNFLINSFVFNDSFGQIFSFFLLLISAAELSIGLTLVVLLYNFRGLISSNLFINIKG